MKTNGVMEIPVSKLPKQMIDAARDIGKIIFAYQDYSVIRMETEHGRDPYVWRGGRWQRMRPPPIHNNK